MSPESCILWITYCRNWRFCSVSQSIDSFLLYQKVSIDRLKVHTLTPPQWPIAEISIFFNWSVWSLSGVWIIKEFGVEFIHRIWGSPSQFLSFGDSLSHCTVALIPLNSVFWRFIWIRLWFFTQILSTSCAHYSTLGSKYI